MQRRDVLKSGAMTMAGVLAARGLAPATARARGDEFAAFEETDLIVLSPSDVQFTGLTLGFNMRWSAPNARRIFVPLTERATAVALQRALDEVGPAFSVRGGGHCYEDFVYNDDIRIIIDMSMLGNIGRDEHTGYYFAQAGATLWDAYKELYWRHGVTLPGGSCYSVGLGGHVCGGGYGLLSRLHGLTVDYLSAITVATVNEHGKVTLRRVSRESRGADRLLFWAHTGGGGGNFGLITRYEFADLPRAPKSADILALGWNWSDATPHVLERMLDMIYDLSIVADPEVFGLLKLTHHSSGQIGLLLQRVYDEASPSHDFRAEIDAHLRRHGLSSWQSGCSALPGHPVHSAGPVQELQRLDWFRAVQALNGEGPNFRGKYKSAYMRKPFPREQARAIYRALTRDVTAGGQAVDLSSSLVQVDTYGGRVNDVLSDATAVPQRSSVLKLQYQTYWKQTDKASADAHLGWIRDFYADVYAATGGLPDPQRDATGNVDGCYVNYADADLSEQHGLETALRLYYGENLERLRKAKAHWDPLDMFQHRQSIQPA
jgi:hypothetical protein